MKNSFFATDSLSIVPTYRLRRDEDRALWAAAAISYHLIEISSEYIERVWFDFPFLPNWIWLVERKTCWAASKNLSGWKGRKIIESARRIELTCPRLLDGWILLQMPPRFAGQREFSWNSLNPRASLIASADCYFIDRQKKFWFRDVYTTRKHRHNTRNSWIRNCVDWWNHPCKQKQKGKHEALRKSLSIFFDRAWLKLSWAKAQANEVKRSRDEWAVFQRCRSVMLRCSRQQAVNFSTV